MELPLVVYSHSDYYDLWKPFFDRVNKFYKPKKIYFFVDKVINNFNDYFSFIEINYNDDHSYSDRVKKCLEQVNEENILYLHEDMILYDYVNVFDLNETLVFLKNNSKYKFIRLIKSGIQSNKNVSGFFYEIQKTDFLFSITPTIWNKNFLHNMCSNFPNKTIWELEVECDSYLKNYEPAGLYTYFNEAPRGGHYDSSLFPHICSAIFKGKWNMEYNKELEILFKEHNINKELRGTIH